MSLVFREVASTEVEGAHDWYEEQRPGLGADFVAAVRRAIDEITEAPGRFPVVHRDPRRALVRRFPYQVYYRLVGDDIVVVACVHGSRDPRRWQSRR